MPGKPKTADEVVALIRLDMRTMREVLDRNPSETDGLGSLSCSDRQAVCTELKLLDIKLKQAEAAIALCGERKEAR